MPAHPRRRDCPPCCPRCRCRDAPIPATTCESSTGRTPAAASQPFPSFPAPLTPSAKSARRMPAPPPNRSYRSRRCYPPPWPSWPSWRNHAKIRPLLPGHLGRAWPSWRPAWETSHPPHPRDAAAPGVMVILGEPSQPGARPGSEGRCLLSPASPSCSRRPSFPGPSRSTSIKPASGARGSRMTPYRTPSPRSQARKGPLTGRIVERSLRKPPYLLS
jgi:hypothetical protein